MKRLLLFTVFIHSLYADIPPESVLTKNCLNSYLNTYKSQTDHKAFVYARENDTGKDRCGWGYGYESVQEAKKGAMKQCTSFGLNAECIIVDADGKYLLKEGDFSTISQPDDTPLTTEEEKKLLSDAKPLIRGNCLPFFKDYLKDKGHKAFAYSLDADGTYACGKTYNTSTRVVADKGALQSCDNNKQNRGNKKPKSPCKVYAKGNNIVLETKDFAFEIGREASFFVGKEKIEPKKVNAKAVEDLFSAVKKKQKDDAKAKPLDMNKPQSLEKSIKIAVEVYNKNLPSMMDEELRLDKVGAEKHKMIFYYTLVHFTPKTMGANKLKSLMYEDIKTQVCTDNDTKKMLKKGMLLDYKYTGKNKKHITTFSFDAKTCGYLTNVDQIKKNILHMIKKK